MKSLYLTNGTKRLANFNINDTGLKEGSVFELNDVEEACRYWLAMIDDARGYALTITRPMRDHGYHSPDHGITQ